MIDLFKQILEIAIFPPNESDGIVFIPNSQLYTPSEKQVTGNLTLPNGLFPNHCKLQILPDGEAFVSALKTVLSQVYTSRVFIIPPLGDARDLSEEIRTKFPGLNIEQIVLKIAVETLPQGSLLSMLHPLVCHFSLCLR